MRYVQSETDEVTDEVSNAMSYQSFAFREEIGEQWSGWTESRCSHIARRRTPTVARRFITNRRSRVRRDDLRAPQPRR